MIGQIIKLEAVLLVLPLAVSIIYRERCALSFLITALASLFVGFAVTLISKPGNRLIYAKEGFVIVALAWLALSAIVRFERRDTLLRRCVFRNGKRIYNDGRVCAHGY